MLGYMNARKEGLKTEPTLYDVLDVMQKGFERVENKLAEHDVRFDHIETQFNTDLRAVHKRLFKIELKLEDKADTILNHEERVVSLEHWKKGMGKRGLAGA